MATRFDWLRRRGRVALLLDLLTAAVIASVAIALAGLTWRLAGHAGTGAITVPGANRLPATLTAVDVAPALALQPFGRASATDGAQPTTLQVVLKGLIFARPAELSTAFVQIGTDPPTTVRAGDSVAGATIQSIGRDRVFLLNGGRTEFLAFPDPFGTPTPPGGAAPATATATAVPGVPPPPPPAGGVPPAPAAPSPAALLSRLNATPTAGGLRIGAGAPGGLQSGDVIASVNGQSLSDPAAAQSVLAAAQSSGAARVEIVRNGQRVTLTVPTR